MSAKDDEKPADSPKEGDDKEEGEEKSKTVLVPEPPPTAKPGDYQIQVHIIEARDLKGRDATGMSDPVVRIETMGTKKNTTIKKQSANCTWDEVLYFQCKDMTEMQIEMEKVRISVYDANTVLRDVLIGAFDFDMSQVYYRKNHEFYRCWCALTDVTGEFQGVQGYLKLSVTVLGPGDKLFIHPDDEDEEESMVLMPPTIEQKGYLLGVQTYVGSDLPVMDLDGILGNKCDPYVQVEFGGRTSKGTKKKGLNVAFQEEIQVPVKEPIMSDAIKITMWDYDLGPEDDIFGTKVLSYKKLKENGFKPTWLHFYGAPEGRKGPYAQKMDQGFVEASTYHGKLLMSMTLTQNDNPKPGLETCPACPEADKPRQINYIFQVDLYEALEISKNGKWSVELSIGSTSYASKEIENKGSVVKFYSAIQKDGNGNLMFNLPEDVEQCPDIFIYLVRKKKRVNYRRFQFKDLIANGWKTPPQWIHFKEDKSLVDILNQESFPGILLAGIRCGPADSCPSSIHPVARPFSADGVVEEKGAEEKKDSLSPPSKSTPAFINTGIGNLKITAIEGKDLPAADSNGKSDPFIKIKIGGDSWKTKVIDKSLNPVWNETHEFKDVPLSTEVNVEVFDHDMVADDKLGNFSVAIASISTELKGKDFSTENWFLIGSDKSPNAKVKLRFEYRFHSVEQAAQAQLQIEKDAKSVKNIFAAGVAAIANKATDTVRGKEYFGQPMMTGYQLRAHIYQARQLTAADLSGTSDPYVVIRCAGQSVQTSIKEQTLNPIWYTTKCLSIQLPNPLSLAPDVIVDIYDRDVMGDNELLGRVAVPVRQVQSMNPSVEELDPVWFDLKDPFGDPADGGILASFQLLPVDLAGLPLPILKPKSVPMFIEISTLGLRSLNSVLGINKAHIEFELPGEKKFVTNPSARPTPKNPNFLQVLKIPVKVPLDPRFAPALNVTAVDNILGGFIKRRIGTSALMLEKYMEKDEKGDWKSDQKLTVLDENELEREIAEQLAREKEAEAAPSLVNVHESKVSDPSHFLQVSQDQTISPSEAQESEAAGLLSEKEGKVDFAMIEMEPSKTKPVDDETKGDEKVDGLEEKKAKGDDDEKTPLVNEKKQDDAYTLEWGEKVAKSEDSVPKYRKGRQVYQTELESNMMIKPFDEVVLMTGKKKPGLFGKGFRKVGLFKGLVRLTKDKDSPGGIDPADLLQPKDVFVRLYALRGKALTPMDANGKSDPYLVVSLGHQKISMRSNYLSATCDPEFYDSFEFASQIPGPSELRIDVMDWDGIGDDLIGSTSIDVEDRWFCKEWRKLSKKPIEWRTLQNPSSSITQGSLELWVDIYDAAGAKANPMIEIKPPPKEDWELRVIIWGCKEVTIKDEITQQNDLYITGLLDTPGQRRKKTDVHLRSKKGKGSFNWRMRYDLQLPLKSPRFSIQIWDMDFFSANDSICEAYISLKSLCEKAFQVKDRLKLVRDGKDRFWIDDLRHPNEGDKSQGQVEVSFELLPKALTSQLPAGDGRSDPNMNPVLPPPEGRLEWLSLLMNPFALLKELLGDRLYYKLCCGLFIIMLTALLIFFAPTFFSNIFARLIIK